MTTATVAPSLHPLLIKSRAANRAYRSIENEVAEALRPVNLSTARCLVLEALERRCGMSATVGELAFFCGTHRTTVGASVTQLERAGLVSRTIDHSDARKTRVTITQAGSDALGRARDLLNAGGPTS